MALTRQKRRIMTLISLLLVVLGIAGLETLFGRLYYFKRNQDIYAFTWDTKTFWQFKPGYKGKSFGIRIKINNSGFRGKNFPVTPKPEVRILALGDSRTYGFGADDGWAYPHIVQQQLRRQGYENAQVINAGVLGYSAVQSRARFEQLRRYKPDIAVFAPGHNDRRYLLFTPPDSVSNFQRMAWSRKIVDALSISQVFYGLFYELSQSKLKATLKNPPPLNQVQVRVNADKFERELRRFVALCRQNGIQPFFLILRQNPNIFAPLEKAHQWLKQGRAGEALTLLKRVQPSMHVAGQAYCHYLIGQAYSALGDSDAAEKWFAKHKPIGSVHGEALLRSEEAYIARYEKVAHDEQVPIVDSRQAIEQINQRLNHPRVQEALNRAAERQDAEPPRRASRQTIENIELFLQKRYLDECHFDNVGHTLIGLALTEALDPALTQM